MCELPRPGDLVISKSTFRSPTARYAAQSYIRRGWKPIPVGFRSKRLTQWRWQHRGVTEVLLDTIFPEGKLLNVGVIQGGTSGGLTDVDLDCSEAIALAKIVLPKTAAIGGGDLGRGRGAGGRGADHGDGVGWSGDADGGRRGGGVGGDLGDDDSCGDGDDCGGEGGGPGRGGHGGADAGAQTIFPGSVHESGEEIRWVNDGDPARADAPPYTPDEFLKFVTDVTSIPARSIQPPIAALEGLPERLHVRDKASITTCAGMATPIVIG
jgi:hypothetical protein